MELEEKLKNAPSMVANSGGSRLPRSARHVLTGHRGTVSALAFHPVYTVIASASEDTTVKLWDYDGGDLERSLKGHVKAVTGCVYDPDGQYLSTASCLQRYNI
jgi:platelet-activating factor acetylhydrolase IB subunit alpha